MSFLSGAFFFYKTGRIITQSAKKLSKLSEKKHKLSHWREGLSNVSGGRYSTHCIYFQCAVYLIITSVSDGNDVNW